MKEISLNRIFSDNMVFLQNKPIRIFGVCDEADEITVSFDGVLKKAKLSGNKFCAEFEPHKAGEGYSLKVFGKESEITLKNIAVGEVFIAGGQSNMQFMLKQSNFGALDLFLSKDYDIRAIRLDADSSSGWEKISIENSAFSAVAYYFAKALKEKLDVPVGIIDMNKGATSVLHWVNTETSLKNEVTSPYVKRNLYDYGILKEEAEPYYMGASFEVPHGYFYEKCVKDIEGFSVKGVLWYQGESDAGGKDGADAYKTAFSLMLSDWRENFKDENLPFITTLLGSFAGEWIGGLDGKAWAYMREAQTELFKNEKNVYLISAVDCGNALNIHPMDKHTVGKRMAACALNEIYGFDIPYKCPEFKDAVLDGDKLIVSFENTYGRIFVPNSELYGFEIKDAYKVWHPVVGKLEGENAVFDLKGIYKPQFVRAYFKNMCEIRIYNNYGNPLIPFGKKRITR